MEALPRQDPAVEEVDRRRLRIDGDEDRPALPGGAPGLFAGAVRVGTRRASDGRRGKEVAAAVRQVEKGARSAGHFEDLVEKRRSDALEIVDRGGRREHRVHRRFDVPRLESPRPFVVKPGRFVEVVAQRSHLVARPLVESRGLPALDQLTQGARGRRAGSDDAAVHVADQPEKADENQAGQNHERRGRRIPLSFELLLREEHAAREHALELLEGVPQLRGRRGRFLVTHGEDVSRQLARAKADRLLGGRAVDVRRGIGPAERLARALGQRMPPDRAERGLQLRAGGVVLREVVPFPDAGVPVEAVGRLGERGHGVGRAIPQLRVARDPDGRVIEAENRVDRVVEPRPDHQQAGGRVEPHPRPQGLACRSAVGGRRGGKALSSGICHRMDVGRRGILCTRGARKHRRSGGSV